MMITELKRNLSTKILALVAASCALVTVSRAARAHQTAGDWKTEVAARYARRRDTTLRASGILMGDKASGPEIVTVHGNVRVK